MAGSVEHDGGVPVRRCRVVVDGVVQGVFFRASARDVAVRNGVNGHARNLPDGRVELELEGDDDAVARVLEWARHGPRRAVVTAVDVTAMPPTGAKGFRTL